MEKRIIGEQRNTCENIYFLYPLVHLSTQNRVVRGERVKQPNERSTNVYIPFVNDPVHVTSRTPSRIGARVRNTYANWSA